MSVGRPLIGVKPAQAALLWAVWIACWAGPGTAETPVRVRPVWQARVPRAGSGSPGLADLDEDGVTDVVVGTGVEGVSGAVVALDGRTGRRLWRTTFTDQVYATPTFLQIDRRGPPDLVVAGRFCDAVALRGSDGKRLWSLRRANPRLELPLRNLHGAVRVRDLDTDGVPELLLPQSGQADDKLRLVGRLYLVSGRTGRILRQLKLPDGEETYGLPAVRGDTIYLGSGGERRPGHLLGLRLPGLTEAWRVPSEKKGFIGSPILRGRRLVAGAFDGTLFRIAPASGAVRWRRRNPGFESYVSPALGRFGGSDADVVTLLSKGVYPRYDEQAVVLWLDGRDGRELDRKQAGVMSAASPLVLELDGDDRDEVLAVANDRFGPTVKPQSVTCSLLLFSGREGHALRWRLRLKGLSHATPHLADLDGDGKLDLVHARWGHVGRWTFEQPRKIRVRWGRFRGPTGDGVMR